MLGHPALVLALVGGDAQREALLAQQHVAAVAGVDGPDGVVLGELDDVAVLLVDVGLGSAGRGRSRWIIAQLLAAPCTPTRVMMSMFSTT